MESTLGRNEISKGLYSILKKQKEFEYPVPKISIPKFNSSDIKEQLRPYIKDLLNYDTIISAEDSVAIGLADEVQSNT
jgi:hypothetical protein